MSELMTFNPGQKLTTVAERRTSFMPEDVTVKEVIDHGKVIPGISHRYSIVATTGQTYSGWWFDPNAESVFSSGMEYDDISSDS